MQNTPLPPESTLLPSHGTTRRGALMGLSALALALGGCGGGSGSDTPQPGEKADFTLLAYILGSDLERRWDCATGNIEEMQSIPANARVNVVLTTGGSNKDGWRTVQRKRVKGAQIETLADLGKLNMGRKETLQDFVTWGMQAYPAERTLLVLWNHGGGPNSGIGPDEIFLDDGGFMPLNDIRAALAGATQAVGRKLSLVSFDTCLMGGVEVAQALAPYADYLVASEELEPGDGQDWAALVQQLTTQPADSTEAIGRNMVDAYLRKTLGADPSADATLSVTDLRKMEAVTAALTSVSTTLSRKLAEQPAETWLAIAQARAKSTIFCSPPFASSGLELVDLGLFSWGSLPLPDSERQQLLTALTQAVVYEKHGPWLPDLAGLTLYLPQRMVDAEEDLAVYTGLSFLPAAQRELAQRCLRVGADTTVLPQPVIGAIDWGQGTPQAPGRIEAALHTVAPDLVAQEFAVLQEAPSGAIQALKPLTDGTTSRLIDTDFMDGWLQLPGANGTPVYFSALPDGPRFDVEAPETFLVPVEARIIGTDEAPDAALLIVTDAGQRGTLRTTGWFASGTSTPSVAPRVMPLPENVEIRPQWLQVGDNSATEWVSPSPATPFIPLKPFTRGKRQALPAHTTARLGVLDVRGWVSLSALEG